MDNSEKLTTLNTQDEDKQNKNTTQYVLDTTVPITNRVVSSNPIHGEVYSIQHYVIKFVSDLRQVGGFLRVFRFPPTIKLTAML